MCFGRSHPAAARIPTPLESARESTGSSAMSAPLSGRRSAPWPRIMGTMSGVVSSTRSLAGPPAEPERVGAALEFVSAVHVHRTVSPHHSIDGDLRHGRRFHDRDSLLLRRLTPATNAAAPIRHRLPEILPTIFRRPGAGDPTTRQGVRHARARRTNLARTRGRPPTRQHVKRTDAANKSGAPPSTPAGGHRGRDIDPSPCCLSTDASLSDKHLVY